MLRGLVIRQAFVFVDMALVALVLGVAGVLISQVFEEPSNPFGNQSVEVASLEDPGKILRDVKDRSLYESILRARLFGPGGDDVPETIEAPPPPPPEPVEPEVEETPLSLVLLGTVATHPLDPLASATIENKESRQGGIHVYGLEDEIVEEVFLKEVFPRKVIISNRGKREVLRMDDEERSVVAQAPSAVAPSYRSPVQAQPAGSPERFSLDKQDFIRQLYTNYQDLVTKVQPSLYYDENGQVAGITASNIEEIPLADTLDLKDGDVLQTINNEPIDSEQAIIRLINKYRDSSMFRIGILRDGRPLARTYRLE